MARGPAKRGLKELGPGSPDHAVVVLHGIRQTAEDMRPFAEAIAANLHGPRILLYGYNHTRGLNYNGQLLFDILQREIPMGRVDLVGYSMGGLVARLAASEQQDSNIHTVVTLATPNRGALSNAELTMLGQMGRQAFEFMSPIIPRSEGIKDLTRTRRIMSSRRKRLLNEDATFKFNGDRRRYVSIPALWYGPDRAVFEFGPSIAMSGLVGGLRLAALSLRIDSLNKPHDGIVTETSNNLVLADGNDWAEFHLTRPGPSQAPALCHAVIEACDEHDHMSLVHFDEADAEAADRSQAIADLVSALIDTLDWRDLKSEHPHFIHARLHPFAVQP